MADQEFLASFAVDIDESGVSRLQAVLEENRDLADEVAAAFSAATAAIPVIAHRDELCTGLDALVIRCRGRVRCLDRPPGW